MGAEDWAWFASASAFALSTCATPGPNNTMVTASGATWGFRRTVPHVLGITLGFPVMLIAVALGAGSVFTAIPWLQDVLRWLGGATLLWLAWRIATAKPEGANQPAAGKAAPAGRPLSFLQAAAFQWINPKAWVIAVSAVITYTAGGDGPLVRSALLGAIFVVFTVPALAFWMVLGIGAARLLRTPRALRGFNLAMAALLVASLVPLLRD